MSEIQAGIGGELIIGSLVGPRPGFDADVIMRRWLDSAEEVQVHAGDVLERDNGLIAEEHPGAALAEAQGLVVGALGLPEHEEEQRADEHDGQEGGQDDSEPRSTVRRRCARDHRGRGARGRVVGAGERHIVVDVGRELARYQAGLDDVLAGLGIDLLELYLKLLATLCDLVDFAVADQREERIGPVVRDRVVVVRRENEHVEQRRGADDEHQSDDAVAKKSAVQVGKASG